MKKALAIVLATMLLVLCFVGCGTDDAAQQGTTSTATTASVPFEVGTDTTEYTVDGWDGYNCYPVNLKIVAGDDVLYNGTVTLSSNDMFVSEATFAAIVEKGLSSDGVQAGFINSIGDYVSGSDADGNYMYWGYTVNGKYVPFACNQMRVLEGDYILWEFQTYAG